MKLSDYRSDYYAFSAKASEIARQLSFAGIALIWIFKPEQAALSAIPASLLWPAVYFVIALGLDLLQASYGAFVWGAFSRYHEMRGKRDNDSLDAPPFFNWPTIVFFWGKISAVVIAYVQTLSYIHSLIDLP